ncbi:MAG: 4Fe-4S dicluster domain-containing protein [Promethearchaeota archaeon]|nr:MAG: 4Fe-4S dicluster domain-containing protein [Candidatus Lokiarchaeota archaeon]
MSVINFDFRNEVLSHNASLSYCYQCSTCSGGCPVALLTQGSYNPRKIIEEAILGLEEKLVEKQEPNSWLCSTCQKCVELCPQKVELTEIFTLIKNKCFKAGKVPEAFMLQGQAVMDNGVAIPYGKAIITRREKLGLPNIKISPINEIKTILEATGFDKHIVKEDT